jgi:hypothetical protein
MALRSELHCGSVWLKIGLAAKVSEKKLLWILSSGFGTDATSQTDMTTKKVVRRPPVLSKSSQ